MSVRYLFNTDGTYVAFISGHNVFSLNCDWIGFVVKGNLMYDVSGDFKGYILDDDRVAVNASESRRTRLMRPMKPMRRLRMLPLRLPYKDVFSKVSVSDLPENSIGINSLSSLLESKLVAADGTILGKVNTNRFDSESLLNPYGAYG
jgi:hypothetical protein